LKQMEDFDIPSLQQQVSVEDMLDKRLQAVYKESTPQECAVIHAIKNYIEEYFGSRLTELSLNSWLADEDFPGPQVLVENYQQITNSLAPNLDILFNSEIIGIDSTSPASILIHTSKGQIFRCHQLLITVPLGVLKSESIKFSPPLPSSKIKAIDHIGYGTMNKIVLGFSHPFWEDFLEHQAEFFSYVGASETDSFHFLNLRKPYGIPALVTFTYGTSAQEKEKLTDSEVATMITDVLKKMFPGLESSVYEPEKVMVTRWFQDPFARGSYSFMKVGATSLDYDEMASNIDDRIFFAGEATSKEYLGTAHGSFITGVKAAQEIAAIRVIQST